MVDPGPRGLAPLGAAGQQPDVGPERGEALCGGETDSSGGADDDDDAAVEPGRGGGAPRGAAQSIAEARVAADDAAIQQGVEPSSSQSVQLASAKRSSASRRASA